MWRETFVVEFFPCDTPYSVVYDPTAFMACKLVVVAWLKAYGAATKPRAPCGTAATCDAARHALVSRLLTKYLCRVTPPYHFVLKIFLLGNVQVFKREIHNGLMQKCSFKINKRWFEERKYDMVSVYLKAGCGRVKERKRRVVRKVSSG